MFERIKYLIAILCASLLFGCADSGDRKKADAGPRSGIVFEDGTNDSNIRFRHIPTRTYKKLLPEIMGSGLAICDFDRDGDPDILFVNSGAVESVSRPATASNKLYLNDGTGRFADKTSDWGLTGTGYGQGVAVGDIDNDGFTDVLLTNFEGDNRLLKNTGKGFIDVTARAGLRKDGEWATSAGFGDFDGDGLLDLFIVRYVDFSPANPHKVYRNRMLIYSTPIYYEPVRDSLYRNTGGGRFVEASGKSGITTAANGLALAIGDIDKDGDVDIYVANDTDPNQLWINRGGTFSDIAQTSGSAYSETGNAEASMGVDLSDTDGDGREDIAVTNFQGESTAIYRQIESLFFEEISDSIGIGRTARERLKFGIEFFDADNDGDEDLVVANGHIEDNVEENSGSVTFAQPNTIYENLGDGSFRDITRISGNAFSDKQVSRGLGVADLDGDGDLDFVVSNNGGTAQVVLNRSKPSGGFVSLWLEGVTSNRNAIGARVKAKIGETVIERQVMGAQSYLSVSDFRIHLGLGSSEKIDELSIYWPDGDTQTISDLAGGRFYYIRQGSEPVRYTPGDKMIPVGERRH